jgi:dihydrofolate reductase
MTWKSQDTKATHRLKQRWQFRKSKTMIKMIAAASINGVIGVNNELPWQNRWKDDMTFFRTMTKDSIVVMGRKTYQSIGGKPLPKRENRVVASKPFEEKAIGYLPPTSKANYTSLEVALAAPNPDNRDIWIIGGETLYTETVAKNYAQEIYLTLIPETIDTAGKTVSRFPFMHPLAFDCEKRMMDELLPMENKDKLIVAIYRPSKTVWTLSSTASETASSH